MLRRLTAKVQPPQRHSGRCGGARSLQCRGIRLGAKYNGRSIRLGAVREPPPLLSTAGDCVRLRAEAWCGSRLGR